MRRKDENEIPVSINVSGDFLRMLLYNNSQKIQIHGGVYNEQSL
jgi:hypothetical protein